MPELQNILRELDYDIPVTSVFDSAAYKSVRNYQSRHPDKHNTPHEVDGKDGDLPGGLYVIRETG